MKRTRFLVQCALIAAAYAALTLLLSPLSFGPLQARLSETLTVLAYFSPAAVAGLSVGCAIANLWSPFGILDIVFGTLATLIGALATYAMPKKGFWRFLAPLPSVLSNAFIIAGVLTFAATGQEPSLALYLTELLSIGLPQLLICYLAGLPLLLFLQQSGLAQKFLSKGDQK